MLIWCWFMVGVTLPLPSIAQEPVPFLPTQLVCHAHPLLPIADPNREQQKIFSHCTSCGITIFEFNSDTRIDERPRLERGDKEESEGEDDFYEDKERYGETRDVMYTRGCLAAYEDYKCASLVEYELALHDFRRAEKNNFQRRIFMNRLYMRPRLWEQFTRRHTQAPRFVGCHSWAFYDNLFARQYEAKMKFVFEYDPYISMWQNYDDVDPSRSMLCCCDDRNGCNAKISGASRLPPKGQLTMLIAILIAVAGKLIVD